MKTIGKFIIRGLLGQGGMGRVYKVSHPVTGKIIALKLLRPNPFLVTLLGQKAIRDMFTREAVTMAGIRHPHVAGILDYDEDKGQPYYTMEYYGNNLGTLIGESFDTERPSRIIPLDKAIDYTRQVLSGLSRLHFSGIIHRDIKPFNILVTDEDQVKICDFGLSKLHNESFAVHGGLKVGSPFYAPPEQEDAPDTVDVSADLFAVGVMLYRMATGRLPRWPDLLPSLFNRDLSPYWDKFILRACDPHRRHRYPNARAMMDDLDDLGRRWDRQKEAFCVRIDDPETPHRPMSLPLRSTPLKIARREAPEAFDTDALMRPRRYIQNLFSPRNDHSLIDQATSLIWQQSGTPFPVTLAQARDYIANLNQDRHGGIDTWRLPTTCELLSLVDPPPRARDHCRVSVFDPTQTCLWSADRSTFISAWTVNLTLGFAGVSDMTGFCHARAVAEA
jgi:serine/threonine-protein kinase